MKKLAISAGGHSSRIAERLSVVGLPCKHLLPLGNTAQTILGKIVADAWSSFDSIEVFVNSENFYEIEKALKPYQKASVILDEVMDGPLGPLSRVDSHDGKAFCAAGDLFTNVTWAEFEEFHDSHELPVSILTARSNPMRKAATFTSSNGIVERWVRKPLSEKDDYINIGMYIINEQSEAFEILTRMEIKKEDAFFEAMIDRRLLSAYTAKGLSYNINDDRSYQAVCMLHE